MQTTTEQTRKKHEITQHTKHKNTRQTTNGTHTETLHEKPHKKTQHKINI